VTGDDLWTPTPGATLQEYVHGLEYLSDGGRQDFVASTVRILGRCSPPTSLRARRSVLVVGEVQSGKTSSFTAVCALARDNAIPLIVLLAGTKKPLLMQTFDRLNSDLRVGAGGALPQWQIVKTPKRSDYASIRGSLETWTDPTWPSQYRRGVIVTALKTKGSINKIRSLIEWLNEEGHAVPTLIIDDEADQAGLNLLANRDDTSSTYEAILELREAVLAHSFVMYTATPQANLLIELEDRLSPDSVVTLPAGESYVGGADLFGVAGTFFRQVPTAEIPDATNPLPTDGPPATLKRALAYYFVALTVAQQRRIGPKPLSMLIHPASTKAVHQAYERWVRAIVDNWELALSDQEMRDDLKRLEFAPAIAELERTVELATVFPDVEDAVEFVMDMVRFWLTQVEIRVVNSDRGQNDIRPADWDTKPGWIVIGGNKLERGFTIKNLAVTYMPRGTGINAVDTIQQRGRFFGHKRSYLDLLRGWLNPDTRDSFNLNVETESALRAELQRMDELGLPLKEWRRTLFLGPNMVPTRAAVITRDNTRFDFTEGWRFTQHRLFDPVLQVLASDAAELIEPWLSKAVTYPADTRNLPEDERHRYAPISAKDLLEILVNWPMHEVDRISLDHLLLGLSFYADRQSHLDAHMIFMDNMRVRFRRRDDREIAAQQRNWSVQNLFMGRNSNYVGDRFMRTNDAVTVQIHHVRPRWPGEKAEANPVYAVALAWPAGFNRSLVRQD